MLKKIILCLIIIGAIGSIGRSLEHTAVAASKTPAEVAESERVEARFQKIVRTITLVQRSARNPSSVSFEEILSSNDGNVLCITLRAQNGFGGMNLENVTVVNGTSSTSNAAWNKNCANKPLINVTYARRAL